jgi:hypothetical protein
MKPSEFIDKELRKNRDNSEFLSNKEKKEIDVSLNKRFIDKEILKKQIKEIFETSVIVIECGINEPADIYYTNSKEFKKLKNKILKLLECD